MKRLTLLVPAVVLLAFTACQRFDELEGLDSAQYDAEYALPLLNTSLSIKDALEKFEDLSTIIIDPDGVIHFTYSGDVITQSSDTIFKKINETLSGVPIPITSKRMALQLEFPDGISFDRLLIKKGILRWTFQHKHPDPVQFQMTLPQVSKDGQPLTLTGSLPGYSGSGTAPTYLLGVPRVFEKVYNAASHKAGAGWNGPVAEVTTTEYVGGVARKVTAKFRAYASYAESFADYARLMTNSPRYAAVTQADTPREFAQGLQRAGYATDPAYADKLTAVINTTLRLQRTNG